MGETIKVRNACETYFKACFTPLNSIVIHLYYVVWRHRKTEILPLKLNHTV
jgi:hypothetical protein